MSHLPPVSLPVSNSTPTNGLTRRRFIQASAASAAMTFAAPAILRARGLTEKLNVAVIGSGGRGGGNLAAVAGTENIVTLCDASTSLRPDIPRRGS